MNAPTVDVVLRPSRVEQWAVEVLSRVEKGSAIEDDRVEFKRQPKALPLDNARRIAGHANQAREDEILWIFGIDDDGTRPDAATELLDLAAWWPAIESCFDDVAPSPVSVVVDGLLAVGFETERRPYVVKTGGEAVSREVPWRDGTRIRTAQRHDLLKLLVPVVQRPHLTILSGKVRALRRGAKEPHSGVEMYDWDFNGHCYVDASNRVVFPDHRGGAVVSFTTEQSTIMEPASYGIYRMQEYVPQADLAHRGEGQLIVNGPTSFVMSTKGQARLDRCDVIPGIWGRLRLRLGIGGLDDHYATAEVALVPDDGVGEPEDVVAVWHVGGKPSLFT